MKMTGMKLKLTSIAILGASPLICYDHACRIFEKDGVKLVVDSISYDFVRGATVDYVDEMIRSAFQVRSLYPS